MFTGKCSFTRIRANVLQSVRCADDRARSTAHAFLGIKPVKYNLIEAELSTKSGLDFRLIFIHTAGTNLAEQQTGL